MNIESGLVIAPKWLARILAGDKTWEIRSRPNTRAARIALARGGGGPLMCTCMIGKSIPLRIEEFAKHFDKHRVPPHVLYEFYEGRDLYAWPLSDIQPLAPPINYKHPGGGSWVTLTEDNVPEFERLQVN